MTDDTHQLRVPLRTIGGEAIAGITQRPGRSALTALGTVLGVAVLVAVLALTSSASVQISRQFDLQEATLLRVSQEPQHPTRVGNLRFAMDAPARAEQITGVTNASLIWTLKDKEAANPPRSTGAQVLAATAGVLDVSQAVISAGRGFDQGHEARSAKVAVIGSGAASDLGVSDLSRAPAILIDGIPFTVIGIISDTQRLPELLSAVTIPATTAHQLWSDPSPEEIITLAVVVEPGAATVVGEQLPLAMSATTAQDFTVQLPPDPNGLRESVSQQLSGLFIILALVCLIVGIIGIANTTFVSVIERTGEIGLRRAMGARPSHIANQFIMEAAILGVLGGLIGTSVGVITVVAVSAALGWTAVVPTLLLPAGPLIGLASGIIGGAFPAARASKLEPVEALRT